MENQWPAATDGVQMHSASRAKAGPPASERRASRADGVGMTLADPRQSDDAAARCVRGSAAPSGLLLGVLRSLAARGLSTRSGSSPRLKCALEACSWGQEQAQESTWFQLLLSRGLISAPAYAGVGAGCGINYAPENSPGPVKDPARDASWVSMISIDGDDGFASPRGQTASRARCSLLLWIVSLRGEDGSRSSWDAGRVEGERERCGEGMKLSTGGSRASPPRNAWEGSV
jgi:hypothetical protein